MVCPRCKIDTRAVPVEGGVVLVCRNPRCENGRSGRALEVVSGTPLTKGKVKGRANT